MVLRTQLLSCVGLVAALVLSGCNGRSPVPRDVAADAPQDGTSGDTLMAVDTAPSADDTSPADIGVDTARPALPVYLRDYPRAATFPAPAGKIWRRGIVHLHSTHSHDACDGMPRLEDGGGYNLACLDSLRAALCKVAVDFAYLTDHRSLMATTPFLDLLLYDPATDTLVERDGVPVANRVGCPDGSVVTTTVGMEGDLMPLAFPAPLDPDPSINDVLLGGSDVAAADRFRAAGALLWVAHTEGHTVADLEAWQVQGLELYNLHANMDPRVLGLPLDSLVQGLLPFIMDDTKTSPDLALLLFLTENTPALDAWATLLESRPVAATAGTDSHQNVVPQQLHDGERFDSYRRMMAWFSNYVLADDESLEAFHSALAGGRLYVAFDTLASPAGFDAAVFDASGQRYEMGSTVPFEAGQTLRVQVPAVDDSEAPPVLETRLLRAEAGHWVEAGSADGPGEHSWPLTAGIYRVEVRMTPLHLDRFYDHWLPDGLASRAYPWIYTNAFRVLPL